MVYPDTVWRRISGPRTEVARNPATGRAASFECGCFVEFSVTIDDGRIDEVGLRTNGCGYMLAAADVLTSVIKGRELGELQGLDDAVLSHSIDEEIGTLPPERRQCAEVCFDALHKAFAEHRVREIDEFRGEKALVCTCFGVSEETIEHLIAADKPRSVDEVTVLCRAGGGCGSCRMLIQEMLDNA